MNLRIYDGVGQGSEEWFELRRGIVTASTVGQLITPSTIKPANNDKSRGLIAQLVAERITGWTEPTYQSSDMLRGTMAEPVARAAYAAHMHAEVTEIGFMIREFADGSRLGFSPDGLVGENGLLEIKSRSPKAQVPVVIAGVVPGEHMGQVQSGLLVSGREWLDYVSYSGGMALFVVRVFRDEQWFDAIREAVTRAEQTIVEQVDAYRAAVVGLPDTERIEHFEGIEF